MVIRTAMLCNNDVSSFEVKLVYVTMSDLHKEENTHTPPVFLN